jgi:hypothetical protein
MNRKGLLLGSALLVVLGAATFGRGAPRPAREIIADFDTVKYPGFIENITLQEYRKLLLPAAKKQCRLALELYRDHPEHAQVPRLMGLRWTLTVNSLGIPQQAIEETEQILKDGPSRLQGIAATRRAYAGLSDSNTSLEDRFRYVREALVLAPQDKRWGPKLLYRLAFENTANPKKQRQLVKLAVDRFGKSAERSMRSEIRLLDRIGETIDLEFNDLLTGKPAKTKTGRPTIVFVWGPTAKSRKDVADFKRAEGVEIRVVYSGGPSEEWARKKAKEHGITWPIYFDEREFRDKWAWTFGVRYARTFFLLDKDGKVLAMSQRAEPLLKSIKRSIPGR